LNWPAQPLGRRFCNRVANAETRSLYEHVCAVDLAVCASRQKTVARLGFLESNPAITKLD
jgi:hypothetical protein